MTRVITFGTFDLLHPGHIRLLRRAKELGDILIVGISSDKLNYEKKQRHSFYNQAVRAEMISSLRDVDEYFIEESLEKKQEYIDKYNADILVMGNDWEGKFDFIKDCKVVYLDRTPGISTTTIRHNSVGEVFTPHGDDCTSKE